MTDELLPAVSSEIATLEAELRTDPRFLKLTALRQVQQLYDLELVPVLPTRPVLEAPAKTRRGRKPKKEKKPRKARVPKKAKTPKAPKVKRERTPKVTDSPRGADRSDDVLAAIRQIQGKGGYPTAESIGRIVKLSVPTVRAAIDRLIAAARLTAHGGRRARTYVIAGVGGAAVEPEPIEDEPEFAEVEEPNAAVIEEATPPITKAIQESADTITLGRAEREVLLACLSAGDNETSDRIGLFADVPQDRVGRVLSELNAKQMVLLNAGKWSLSELGHSTAIAIRERDR